jgi:hypothetical protein
MQLFCSAISVFSSNSWSYFGIKPPPSLGEADTSTTGHLEPMQQRIVPHSRTLRNAREQVKQMVASGVSLRRTKRYLHQWCTWWTFTAECWTKHELLTWFLKVCWEASATKVASMLLTDYQHETPIIEGSNSLAYQVQARA